MENSELVLVLVHQSVLVNRDVAEILLLLVLNINQSINKLCSCGFVVDMPCSSQNLKKQSFQNYYIRLIRKKVRFNFISVSMTKLDAQFFTRFMFICGSF